MDRRLLRYYNRELQHLREMGAEFAHDFPKIAGRLALDEVSCADPYVERLLEGFAFLTARVQLKLDAEFPRFTQSLLETVYPHYLAPTPSMAIVRLEPDLSEGALAGGLTVPRGTVLRSILGKGDQTACEYRTAQDVTLWPLEVTAAEYHTRDLAALEPPPEVSAKAGLRLRIQSTAGLKLSDTGVDGLTFHLRGVGDIPFRLYEQLIGRSSAVLVQGITRPVTGQTVLPAPALRRVGFDDGQALLPYDARSFHGYRLLHEYFVFPQRYLFVEVAGLKGAIERCGGTQADLVFLMREADLELENRVDASNFALSCTPAINLFEKRADRIHVSDRYSEFHVVPDRTRPRDFEVYQVSSVTGHGTRSDQEREFRPFYAATDFDEEAGATGAYFTVSRTPRLMSSRERQFGRRSSYGGSEVYVSLVDARAAPFPLDLRELSVVCLCTNRDLPLQLPVGRGATDFTMDASAPVKSIRCLAGPTPPKPSYAEGETAWRLISHLSLNYLSLLDVDEREGAAPLRELLKLYGEASDPQVRKQVEGVKTVLSAPIVRRVPTEGPIAFGRGIEITVTFDEAAFEGSGAFLFGGVLEQFFAKYVSINSFTETVITTVDRGEVMRWPARMGQRPTL